MKFSLSWFLLVFKVLEGIPHIGLISYVPSKERFIFTSNSVVTLDLQLHLSLCRLVIHHTRFEIYKSEF